MSLVGSHLSSDLRQPQSFTTNPIVAMVTKVVLFPVLLFLIGIEVNGEITSWFTPGHQAAHHAADKAGTMTPLYEILNITAGEKKPRDVSSAGSTASSTSTSGTFAQSPAPAPPPVAPYPPPSYPYPAYGGGGGGFFPGFGGGAGAGLDLALDAGFGGGLIGGIAPYFPIIEKVIVIVGGAILILIFLAILQAFLIKGGINALPGLGWGLDASAAKAFSGAVDIDAGPFHASNSAGGSLAFDKNIGFTQQHVMKGINSRW